jgi:hypothetical protein
MRWKRTKQFVIGAVIFGASNLQTLKPGFVALIVEWFNHILSNTEIPNAFRGKATLTQKRSQNQFLKENQFCRVYEIVGIWTASIQNTSKRFDLR